MLKNGNRQLEKEDEMQVKIMCHLKAKMFQGKKNKTNFLQM